MGIAELSNGIENNSERILEESSTGKIVIIERYLIFSIIILIVAVILIAFGQLLIAGCLIFGGACLNLFVFRKFTVLNKKYIESIGSFLKTDSRKDRTITVFSHKIREPLNNLVLTAEMLNETDLSSKQKELMETFEASTKSMVNTVNELTMESAEQMSYESRRQIQFNIRSTVYHVIELYKLKENLNIAFTLNIGETGNLDCIGDPVILKQIFLDIFNRIEKHNPDRLTKVTITLNTEGGSTEKNLLKITIEAEPKVPLIDENSVEGSHAARLISLVKGKYSQRTDTTSTILDIFISIRSVVREPKLKTSSAKIEELIKKDKTRKELKDLKILLVEDNAINQKITLLTLKPLVNNIDAVSNGKEALDKFGTNNYDLILMDIQMPVMSGLIAAEKIRALEITTNTHIPMIALTANAMIGDKEKCMSVGYDDYITKPFQPSALIERILKLV